MFTVDSIAALFENVPLHFQRLKLTTALVDVDCNTGEFLDAVDTGAPTELLGTKICNDNYVDNVPIFRWISTLSNDFVRR